LKPYLTANSAGAIATAQVVAPSAMRAPQPRDVPFDLPIPLVLARAQHARIIFPVVRACHPTAKFQNLL
jgi:hypothetical protein